MIKILCFGDSITLGDNDDEKGGWVDRLKIHFRLQSTEIIEHSISVYNLGVGGETTDGLKHRFQNEFDARYFKGQKTVVVFSYGSNDIVIHKNKNIVPINIFIRNLKECIDYAKSRNAKVILTGILPFDSEFDECINVYGQIRNLKDVQIYNQTIEQLASDSGCQYLDLYNVFHPLDGQDLLDKDGLHPNGKGHQLILKWITRTLDIIR